MRIDGEATARLRDRLVLIASNAAGGRGRYLAASERRRAARLHGDPRAAGF